MGMFFNSKTLKETFNRGYESGYKSGYSKGFKEGENKGFILGVKSEESHQKGEVFIECLEL